MREAELGLTFPVENDEGKVNGLFDEEAVKLFDGIRFSSLLLARMGRHLIPT